MVFWEITHVSVYLFSSCVCTSVRHAFVFHLLPKLQVCSCKVLQLFCLLDPLQVLHPSTPKGAMPSDPTLAHAPALAKPRTILRSACGPVESFSTTMWWVDMRSFKMEQSSNLYWFQNCLIQWHCNCKSPQINSHVQNRAISAYSRGLNSFIPLDKESCAIG